ncbi:helix-turn-helix transcriptional regulator [Aureivirga marina]|uniref:helix-turn-helix transcriptional regulator n=1 Tax=Aureivirga marina TaxID=1182451 RepID=UPI0018CA46A8|nr:AraC family transcriptional regulator [Aureivirga marina]
MFFSNSLHIQLSTKDKSCFLKQIQEKIHGVISKNFQEQTLSINSAFANGKIQKITSKNGFHFWLFDIAFFQETTFIFPQQNKNFIHFCSSESIDFKGIHTSSKTLSPFQFLLSKNEFTYTFSLNKKVQIILLEIDENSFIHQKINSLLSLNSIFEKNFSTTNILLANYIQEIEKITISSKFDILKIEGIIFQFLAEILEQVEKENRNQKEIFFVAHKNLKVIQDLAETISMNISENYTLELLSKETNISQAKLQEGFKFLYKRTVTEFIRDVRLEKSKELIKNTELSISEIVYSIGFSSRSYFSKIFKEKYNITPIEYKKVRESSDFD